MKKNFILLGVLVAVIALVGLNVFTAGTGHVEVVQDNVQLVKSNNELKTENQKLSTENKQLKVAADSLTKTVASLDSAVNNYEQVIEKGNQSARAIIVDDDAKPYKIDVPIEEVPNSPN
jgi:cell division protein FtsB